MKIRYTNEQFNNSKSKDLLPCECYQCNQIFYSTKHTIQRALNPNNVTQNKFCSIKCRYSFTNKKIDVICNNCNNTFQKQLNQIVKTKNNFCCQSCAATYNNKHKTTGNRRSKLEIYLEEQLTFLYPNLPMDFNKKDTIGSELDIYIPSLNIAFELNGIFHYEPIYGINKLEQIKNNDHNKFKLCIEHKIDLCIIDTSSQKYVKPSTSKKYLDIITNIINQRTILLTS